MLQPQPSGGRSQPHRPSPTAVVLAAAAVIVGVSVWAFVSLLQLRLALGPAASRSLTIVVMAVMSIAATIFAGRCRHGVTAEPGSSTTGARPGPWPTRSAGNPPKDRRRDHRGAVWTMFAAVLAPSLLVGIGVVVDGGGKVAAARQADSAAYTAVRFGQEAAATNSIAQANTTGPAVHAAKAYLADAGVTGTATVHGRTLTVTTTTTYDTKFLGIIGVNQLTAHGSSSAQIAGVYR